MANKPCCKEVITFYLVGKYRSYNAAINWAWDKGYLAGSNLNSDVLALKKGRKPNEWNTLTDTEKANIDGIMYSENFREGAVTINIYK